MSLFKTRDIWTTHCDNDLFDIGCLQVANLGCNNKIYNSIITGSYNGFLRIYNPSFPDNKKESRNLSSTTNPHDLICEKSFPSPIIQIETGRFVK
jgi:Bardet-Biedl syndrome 9 protein